MESSEHTRIPETATSELETESAQVPTQLF